MTLFTKTAASTIAGAVLVAAAGFAAPANAAPTLRVAPAETSAATQVGYKFHYGGGYGHHWGGGHGHGYYHPKCFWKKKKFWGHYGWYWKKVKVCY